jgi:hypothetical protein
MSVAVVLQHISAHTGSSIANTSIHGHKCRLMSGSVCVALTGASRAAPAVLGTPIGLATTTGLPPSRFARAAGRAVATGRTAPAAIVCLRAAIAICGATSMVCAGRTAVVSTAAGPMVCGVSAACRGTSTTCTAGGVGAAASTIARPTARVCVVA